MKIFNIIKTMMLLFIFCSCSKSIEHEISYYESGELKFKVPLKNNFREGKLIEYFEDGKIKGYSNWYQGLLHGETKLFNQDGSLSQINRYNKGIRCCESSFYTSDGKLRETQFFDERGRLIDYIKYNEDGIQDLDIQTRMAIFIPERDTINEGDIYKTEIKLGNMHYNSIEVVLGDPTNKYILKNNPKLPKKNERTAQLEIEDYEIGLNTITGVVVERDSSRQKRKELIIIPFKHDFYVSPSSNTEVTSE